MKLLNLTIGLLILISCSKGGNKGQNNLFQPVDTVKENPVIKIMSYNIRHGSPINHDVTDIQLDSIAAAINAQKPDLVALQEVDVHTKRSGTGLDEAGELGKLTGMHYFFSKSIDYQGGEYGVAILSRLPILGNKRYSLPMPDSTGEARSVAMITVEVFPGIKINFASTHLDLKAVNRLAQVNKLIDISKQSEYPFIVAGDFNTFPESQEIKILQQEFTFACISGCPLTFPSDNPSVTIDYSLLNPAAAKIFKVLRYDAIKGVNASDHLPLLEYLMKK